MLRRLSIALFSLMLSALLFHVQLADALVVRGDDFLIQNRLQAASDHYARALWFDASSASAADRYMFVALQRRSPEQIRSAIQVADAFLSARGFDSSILFDRAMCYLRLKKYRAALMDFRRAAYTTRDPQVFVFAGWTAKRAGRRAEAVGLWRAALRLRSHYLPAAAALAELQR
ncbi:MAG TPA: hypothetical protein VFO29_05515 [Candidatus Rubrimentiphilum sp.]|nr:hypothetical protein [Candidatus Rubrimentiphilum sp.]